MANSKPYIPVYLDYLDALVPFTDEERGRLFTAILLYGRNGEAPDLPGNEKYAWPFIRSQIDRANEAYNKKSQAMTDNVKKRWSKAADDTNDHVEAVTDTEEYQDIQPNTDDAEASDAIQSDTKAYNGILNDTKNTEVYKSNQYKDKEEDKEKNKTNTKTNTTPPTPLPEPDAAEVFQAWDRAKGTLATQAESDKLLAWLDQYGKEKLLYAIGQAVYHCRNGITLSYVEAVLKGDGKKKPQAGRGSRSGMGQRGSDDEEWLAQLEKIEQAEYNGRDTFEGAGSELPG